VQVDVYSRSAAKGLERRTAVHGDPPAYPRTKIVILTASRRRWWLRWLESIVTGIGDDDAVGISGVPLLGTNVTSIGWRQIRCGHGVLFGRLGDQLNVHRAAGGG